MSNALQLIQHPDRQIMDLQGNVQRAVSQLQGGALADAKILTVPLPNVVSNLDILLTHNLGRPLKGYLLARLLSTIANLSLYDSPNVSPQPNVSFIVRPSVLAPTPGPAITLTVVVF